MNLKSRVNMLEGNIFKNMLIFCIPIIITNYIQLLYNAADIMIVGKFGSDEALAGVTSTTHLINLIVNLFVGLSVGINVVVANKVGANDKDSAERAVSTSVYLALIGGLIPMVIGFFSARSLLLLMDTPIEALNEATLYVKYYMLGVPGILMTNFGASVLRSVGDTKRPLYFMTMSGIINVILNMLLVIAFDLGAAGVAIATAFSNYVSATLVLLSMTKLDGVCRLNFKRIKFHLKSALEIARIGIPSGINSCLFSISNTLIQSSINGFGQFAVSGNGIAANIDQFESLAQNSVYNAAMTFTSQNYGAKKAKRLRPIFFNAILLVSVIWFITATLLLIFRVPVLSLYTDNPEVMKFATIKMLIFIPTFIFGGFMEVSTGCIRGLGVSTLPMIVSIMGVCGLRILWIFTFFKASPTLETLYYSYPISWLLTFLVNSVIFFILVRKKSASIKSE